MLIRVALAKCVGYAFPVNFLSRNVNFVPSAVERKANAQNVAMKMATIYVKASKRNRWTIRRC